MAKELSKALGVFAKLSGGFVAVVLLTFVVVFLVSGCSHIHYWPMGFDTECEYQYTKPGPDWALGCYCIKKRDCKY